MLVLVLAPVLVLVLLTSTKRLGDNPASPAMPTSMLLVQARTLRLAQSLTLVVVPLLLLICSQRSFWSPVRHTKSAMQKSHGWRVSLTKCAQTLRS